MSVVRTYLICLCCVFLLSLTAQAGNVAARNLDTLQEAAEQGDAEAKFVLGAFYLGGHGVPKDDALALQWFTKSAEQGNAEAQFALGTMYSAGRGVPQDHARAAQWYQKAADSAAVDEGVIIDRSKPDVVILRSPPGTGLAGLNLALKRSLEITRLC